MQHFLRFGIHIVSSKLECFQCLH